MVRLHDVATGRDNNFNLIRAIAATAVLVSHAYPIALGGGTPEPLLDSVGHSLGTVAVHIFFVLSGFLIAASWDRGSGPLRFVLARGLRLLPGLLVSLVLVAFAMGPLVTTLSPGAYLTDPGTLRFVPQNLALISPAYTLPGVFETNPYPTVEGSIWTLFYEVLCYVGIFAAGMLGLFGRRGLMTAACLATIAAGLWVGSDAGTTGVYKADRALALAAPFAAGTLLWIWRARVVLTLPVAAGLLVLAWAAKGTPAYEPAYLAALAYGIFWLAYVPGGPLRAYNRLGDYSYGIYIYAFPAQGLAVWIWGPMDPLTNMALALPITLVPSVLSWHLVEKPALALRGPILALLEPGRRARDVKDDRRLAGKP